ncbi:MAG: hypothetical protein C4583_03070 [Anaerolineaceae bacterium]|nr:MAG: hypothetical protein C4583_03070 [Anaerolineaceae bacterium]
MTAVQTLQGEKLLVKIETSSGSGVFAHDCLINMERSFALDSELTETVIPDCDDPSLPGWKQRFKDGLSGDVAGAGQLHTPSVETWFNWFAVDTTKNVRIELNGVAGANGGGYWAGAMKLKSFRVTGPRKNISEVAVELVSHGALTWTDNP